MGQDSVDELAGHLGGVLRVIVEGGDDGEDGGTGVEGELHIAEMDAVERSLADAEDEGAALFEANVCSSLDEIRGEAIGDCGEGSHGAGKDDHGVGRVAAAGDVRADVVVGVLLEPGAGRVEEFFGEVVSAAQL